MLYGAAKLLTLTSVLLHAGMGCCAHHDHCGGLTSAAAEVEQQPSPQAHTCSCSFQVSRTADAAEQADSDQPEHTGCPSGESHSDCSDHCSWLTESRVELPADQGPMLPLSMVEGLALNASSDALFACALHASPPPLSELADTLRAKTQVWQL